MIHRSSRRLGLVGALAALAALGCGDFRSPADLKYPQVLAVRLGAPELHPEERTTLDALGADKAGNLITVQPKEVALGPDASGRPITLPPSIPSPIVREGDEWRVQAPDAAQLQILASMLGLPPEAPLIIPLRLTFEMGQELKRVDKAVAFLRTAETPAVGNPVVLEISVDQTPAGEAGATILPGKRPVSVKAEAGGRPLSFAWYTSVGELEDFRSEKAMLEATEAGEGTLLVVARNDRGGVGWKAIKLAVRPGP